jgi:hypothetical protein
MWLKTIWHELTGQTLQVRLVTDSMGALKSMLTTKLPEEKRLRIDLAVLRQGLRGRHFVITWVPSRSNLSDPLTKESESEADRCKPCDRMKRPLLDALRSSCTNLKGVQQVTKTQARSIPDFWYTVFGPTDYDIRCGVGVGVRTGIYTTPK